MIKKFTDFFKKTDRASTSKSRPKSKLILQLDGQIITCNNLSILNNQERIQ